MQLQKYKDIIALAKEKITEAMAPLRAHEMKKKAELEMAKLESQIAEKEQSIQEAASQYPIEFYKVLDAIDEMELTKRKKAQFEKLIKEMFE